MLLLCIDDAELTAELRWEAPAHPQPDAAAATAIAAEFPHVYGPLNLEAVRAVVAIEQKGPGFVLPPDLL